MFRLDELSTQVDGLLVGDPAVVIKSLATLEVAQANQLSFFANPKYLKQLKSSSAGAVLVKADMADQVKGAAIVVADPYLAYARLSQFFDWRAPVNKGVHSTAVVSSSANIDPTAEVSANVFIDDHVVIGARTYIGPNSVIGRDCVIGADTRIESGVNLYPDVHLGNRVIIHSGTVIGSDGFGFAKHNRKWVKIYQSGGVRIGDDVEVGASVTIDRGALSPTRIENGVKLDNQIQVAHNVVIGEDTAIAGCTGISGSTKIGKRCTLAGMVGVAGHLDIADDSHITAMSLVSKSITKPGAYSSGTALEPHQQWKRNVVRFRQLDDLAKRVTLLEKAQADKSE